MIFFHGTTEDYVKNIKKQGLLAATTDQWLVEVSNKKICCISKRPVSGEGGNPLFFARDKGKNGYIVVLYFPKNILMEKKLVAIFENKTLDDYVQYHFFVRQEFRQLGYRLFQFLKDRKDRMFPLDRLELDKREVKDSDEIIYYPQDQRGYYKEIRPFENRYMHTLGPLEFSDEMGDLLRYIGLWDNVWKFLSFHFRDISPETWQTFHEKNKHRNNKEFWQYFYQNFHFTVEEPKQQIWQNWFSHVWLAERKMSDVLSQRRMPILKNCQILVDTLEPEYVLDCIHITTPSGLLPEFRFNEKSGIVQAIWKRVDRILGKK